VQTDNSKRCDGGNRTRGNEPGRICPARAFIVPPDVKYLETGQLDALTGAFRDWAASPKRADTRLSRARVWLIYTLLRHTAARLGEVLGVNDATDLDLARGTVRFRGDKDGEALPREVLLPAEAIQELRLFFADPASCGLRGRVFQMDAGFIRRKFQERAVQCGLPKELANPRTMRHSRAVEMLRGGMPLTVVQRILGHGTVNLTAHYLSFSDQDIQAIVEHYLSKENRMKTSARNSFSGPVTAIKHGKILSEVELTTSSGNKVVSVITTESFHKLGIVDGMAMTATIKAPNVIILKEPEAGKTSARNRFHGTIARINEGMIAAEVVVALPDGTEVCALITDESVKNLDLKVGDSVWTLFKVFAVVLNAD